MNLVHHFEKKLYIHKFREKNPVNFAVFALILELRTLVRTKMTMATVYNSGQPINVTVFKQTISSLNTIFTEFSSGIYD